MLVIRAHPPAAAAIWLDPDICVVSAIVSSFDMGVPVDISRGFPLLLWARGERPGVSFVPFGSASDGKPDGGYVQVWMGLVEGRTLPV